MKIVMLERDSLGADIDLEPLKELGELVEYGTSNEENTPERIKDAEVVLVNKVKLNESTLRDAKKLNLICVTATGTDNVDVSYASARGITVTNVSGYSTDSVAQHTFALTLSLLHDTITSANNSTICLPLIIRSFNYYEGKVPDNYPCTEKVHG